MIWRIWERLCGYAGFVGVVWVFTGWLNHLYERAWRRYEDRRAIDRLTKVDRKPSGARARLRPRRAILD